MDGVRDQHDSCGADTPVRLAAKRARAQPRAQALSLPKERKPWVFFCGKNSAATLFTTVPPLILAAKRRQNAAHGVSRGTGSGKGTSPGGAEEYSHAKENQSSAAPFFFPNRHLISRYFTFGREIRSSANYNRSRNRVVWRMVPAGTGQRLVIAFEWLQQLRIPSPSDVTRTPNSFCDSELGRRSDREPAFRVVRQMPLAWSSLLVRLESANVVQYH